MKTIFRSLIGLFSSKPSQNEALVIESVEDQDLESIDGARNYGWRGGGWSYNGGGSGYYF